MRSSVHSGPAISMLDTDLKTQISTGALSFAEGLPGFAALREATFLSNPEIEPFFYLRALNIPDLFFVCVEPLVVNPDYAVTIPDPFVAALNLRSPSEAWLISIVTLSERREDITANLMCPLVVNVRTRQARQLIMEDAEDLLRYRIWDQLNEENRVACVG